VTDQPNDDRDRPADSDPDAGLDMVDDQAGRRGSVWSRRVAIAVLVTFAAFVLLNVAVVIALLYRSIAPGGGPFGQ
jgi:hypothetical protein